MIAVFAKHLERFVCKIRDSKFIGYNSYQPVSGCGDCGGMRSVKLPTNRCYNNQKVSNRQMIQISEHFQKDLDLAIKNLKEAGCQEIFIFGSPATMQKATDDFVLREGEEDSDIDLAVRGCPPGIFFKTLGRLLRKLKHSVNLVDLDSENPFVEYLKERGELKRVVSRTPPES